MKRQRTVRALRAVLPFVLIFTLGHVALMAQGDSTACPWQRGDLHKMHWAQPPDEGFTGAAVSIPQTVLADDFRCTSTGPMRSIHLWGSFLDDLLPKKGPDSLTFELSIHANMPGSAETWSRPGAVVWSQAFRPGAYKAAKVHNGPQDWYDPIHNQYSSANHRETYQYDFCIEQEPFVGQPGVIYWLAVKELSASMNYTFGWQTTARQLRWNADGVYLHPDDASWFKMTFPEGHRYANETLDLAFVISDGEESLPQYDLGDAPDSSNNVPASSMVAYVDGTVGNFPTAYHAGSPPYGPVHRFPRDSIYLGRWVSLEREADIGVDDDSVTNLDAQTSTADRDGGDDGLQLPVVMPHCGTTTLTYTVTVASPGVRQPYVNVWCDWNRDGDWNDRIPCADGNDIPEWAVQNQILMLAEPGTYAFMTPPLRCWHPGGDLIDPMWLRITISEQPANDENPDGAGPDGGYTYGETEDYYVRPLAESMPIGFDWGDAPADAETGGYPTLAIHGGARHVAAGPWLGDDSGQPDTETDGQPHIKALSDNNTGDNDEKGVCIPPLAQGRLASATTEVNGGGGVVQAWIDFNGDRQWADDEKICDRFLADGIHAIGFTVPANAATGQTFARFRISRCGGLFAWGEAPDGEVEDHYVWIDKAFDGKSWCQRPDTTPQGMNVRMDNSDNKRPALADDFECRMPGRLTHVRLWGSWKDERRGVITRIRLRVHPNDPVGTAGWDKANRYAQPQPEILWQQEYIPDQFEETLYHTATIGGLWWHNPTSGESGPGRDSRIWQIDIQVDPNDAFVQEGLPTAPRTYWLVAEVEAFNGQFGWCTRQWPEHFAADAVSGAGTKLPLAWRESFYPHGHPCYDVERNSVDLAFCLRFDGQGLAKVTCEPTTPTHCPTIETTCPAIATLCPPVETECPSGEVTCPHIPTQFPVVETSCPAVQTECPPIQTVCPVTPTQCQMMTTQCPAQPTLCPPSQTQCPVLETACPVTETQCPTWPTQCPPSATTCPVTVTECQSVQTVCPVIQTSCPMVVTQCQAIQSMCPAVQTVCPATDTACPFVITECPPLSTCCPHAQMQSLGATVERSTALLGTVCPTIEASCPTLARYLSAARASN